MKKVKLHEDGDVLLCGNCNGMYLHMGYVDTYIRTTEDSETGNHTKVIGSKTERDDEMYGNPSERRDGVTLSFTCEDCNAVNFLSLAQNRGHTMIGWFHGYSEQV